MGWVTKTEVTKTLQKYHKIEGLSQRRLRGEQNCGNGTPERSIQTTGRQAWGASTCLPVGKSCGGAVPFSAKWAPRCLRGVHFRVSSLKREGEFWTNDIFEKEFQRCGLPITTTKIKARQNLKKTILRST